LKKNVGVSGGGGGGGGGGVGPPLDGVEKSMTKSPLPNFSDTGHFASSHLGRGTGTGSSEKTIAWRGKWGRERNFEIAILGEGLPRQHTSIY